MDLRSEGRILYISSVDISLGNGPGVNEREFTLALCKAFPEQTHILLPKPTKSLTEIRHLNYTFSRSRKNNSIPALLRHRLSQIRLASQLIKKNNINFLIYRVGGYLPFDQVFIARHYKLPYAIKTLGTGAVDVLKRQANLLKKGPALLHERLVRDLTSDAIGIDVCTQAYYSYFQTRLALDKTKLLWIENATNSDRFYPSDRRAARATIGLVPFDPIIGFVGGRAWERGGMQMLAIARQLLTRYPSLGIVIVGGGKGIAALKRQSTEMGLADHCVFPGQVPYDQVATFINAFDVGIAFDTSERLHVIGNSSQKIRQYIACGKPVVAGLGGNQFLEEEGLGSLVDGHDPEQIATAVDSWLTLSEEERRIHRHKAAHFARRHLSVQKTIQERLDFWNQRLAQQDD